MILYICIFDLLSKNVLNQVTVYSLLPVRHIGNLDFRAENGEEDELRLAVAQTFFVTVQTTTRKMQVGGKYCFLEVLLKVWSKACALLDSVDIWDVSVRCVGARGDTVLVAGLPTIDIISCLDCQGGQEVLFTGHAGGGWMFGTRAVVLVFQMSERLVHR